MEGTIRRELVMDGRPAAAWLPLAVLPLAAGWLASGAEAWVQMAALALSIYAGLKWLTYAECRAADGAPLARTLGYLLAWPGMDAEAFFGNARGIAKPAGGEWYAALGKTALGVVLIAVAGSASRVWHPTVAGWIGMAGIVFVLHFGMFHLLSVAWRRAGVEATPLMHAPILARSLSDFWSNRWNRAFRDAARSIVFRPLIARLGLVRTTLAVFVVSGIVHDLVISIPARAGYGLPTLYFALQAVGLLMERSRVGRRLGLGRGLTGRLYGAAVVLVPAGLLFHPPFLREVVLPLVQFLGGAR